MLMALGNISRGERWLRALLGIAMLAAAWSHWATGLAARALEIFAWAPLLSGASGWSPVYALFGLSTKKRRRRPEIR